MNDKIEQQENTGMVKFSDEFKRELQDFLAGDAREKAEIDSNRIISEAFLSQSNVKYHQFKRFLIERKFDEDEIYADIAAIFRDDGYEGNLQCYIRWLKNQIEDLYKSLDMTDDEDKKEIAEAIRFQKNAQIRQANLEKRKKLEQEDPRYMFRFVVHMAIFFAIISAIEFFLKLLL